MNEKRRDLLAKIAYLYYIQEKSQAEIAQELMIHRSTISRMLKQAKDEQIVTISIEPFDSALFDLEQHFKRVFQLKKMIILPAGKTKGSEEKDHALATEGALFLKQVIKSQDVIGLSWGAMLANMIGKLDGVKETHSTFVPLVGGPSHSRSNYHVNSIVYDMGRHFHGNSIFINAAAVQETKQIRDGIMTSHYFHELLDYWQRMTIALVGIGGPLTQAKSQWRDLLKPEDREELLLREAVGDCCCQFFDQSGKIIKGSLYERTVAFPLECLKTIPYSIGIARSKEKARAIYAVLQKNYLNTLITDEETALEILRLSRDPFYQEYLTQS